MLAHISVTTKYNVVPKIRILTILSCLNPLFYTYNVEIWLKRTDLGNIRNPSMTQNFVRVAQGIAWPASIALPFR